MGEYKQLHIDIINLLLDSDIDSITISGKGPQKTITFVINDIDLALEIEDEDAVDYDDVPRTLS